MKSLYIAEKGGYWYKLPLKAKFFSLALLLLGILFSAHQTVLLFNLLAILLLVAPGSGGMVLLSRLKAFFFFGLFIIIFHSILNPANTIKVYFFGLEGALYGSVVAMRLIAVVAIAQSALITTPPKKIFLLFSSWNKDLGLIMFLLVGFIPVLEQELVNTSQAQQTRGLTWNNIIEKLIAYLAMIIPVIIKALYRAQGMAALLFLRGYDSQDRIMAKRSLKPLWVKGSRILIVFSLLFFLINLSLFAGLRLKVW